MTTLTIKIDQRTKAGKEFMAMSEPFFNNVEGIEIVKKILILTKIEVLIILNLLRKLEKQKKILRKVNL